MYGVRDTSEGRSGRGTPSTPLPEHFDLLVLLVRTIEVGFRCKRVSGLRVDLPFIITGLRILCKFVFLRTELTNFRVLVLSLVLSTKYHQRALYILQFFFSYYISFHVMCILCSFAFFYKSTKILSPVITFNCLLFLWELGQHLREHLYKQNRFYIEIRVLAVEQVICWYFVSCLKKERVK